MDWPKRMRRYRLTTLHSANGWTNWTGSMVATSTSIMAGAGSVERMQLFARELVQFTPEVIFPFTTPATTALQAETSTIPIVFMASDPIGSGFVASLANPG